MHLAAIRFLFSIEKETVRSKRRFIYYRVRTVAQVEVVDLA